MPIIGAVAIMELVSINAATLGAKHIILLSSKMHITKTRQLLSHRRLAHYGTHPGIYFFALAIAI